VAEVEPVSRYPVGSGAGVQVHLVAALSLGLLVQPRQQCARVSLLARRREGGQVVDVEVVTPGEVVPNSEAGHGHRSGRIIDH
jgi:hypothetical protein